MGGYWRLEMRMGRVLGYGNAVGVESVQWGGGGGYPPPPLQAIPWGGGCRSRDATGWNSVEERRAAGTATLSSDAAVPQRLQQSMHARLAQGSQPCGAGQGKVTPFPGRAGKYWKEGGGGGVGDQNVRVPKMAQPDFPNGQFRFFPTMVPLVGGGGGGSQAAPEAGG